MNFKIKPQPYRPGASFLTLLEKEILRFKKNCASDDFCTGAYGTPLSIGVRTGPGGQNADL